MNEDKQNLSEQEFVARINQILDASVSRIDAETCQKINKVRQQALAQNSKSKIFFTTSLGKAITVTVLSVFIAVLIVKTQFQTTMEDEEIEVLELIAAQDTLEMYEELEFYAWLIEEDATS